MEDKVKQVIVIRRKFPDGKGGFFGMRMGKIVAQACHASNGAAFLAKSRRTTGHKIEEKRKTELLILEIPEEQLDWYFERFTKACVQVQFEQELLDIAQKAKDAGLPTFLIEDSGVTEFKGIPTFTCCAIGPALSSEIDKITGHLELL